MCDFVVAHSNTEIIKAIFVSPIHVYDAEYRRYAKKKHEIVPTIDTVRDRSCILYPMVCVIACQFFAILHSLFFSPLHHQFCPCLLLDYVNSGANISADKTCIIQQNKGKLIHRVHSIHIIRHLPIV